MDATETRHHRRAVDSKNFRPQSGLFVDAYVAQHANLIHRLKAKDSTGRWAYYFVLVKSHNEKRFIAALQSKETIDLEAYGLVIDSYYGEKPNQAIKDRLRTKYGFEI